MNILLKNCVASVDWKLSIEFEFTARITPQQNSIGETAFYMIACRGRAVLHQANISEDCRVYFWNKCFETATNVDGLAVVTIDRVTKTHIGLEVILPLQIIYVHGVRLVLLR
jgi:hypothetical protein